MKGRYSRQALAEKAAGYAPYGEVKHVERAVQKIYDGLYLVNFMKRKKDGSRIYRARLHSSTGPIVWAVVRRGKAEIEVGNAAHSDFVRA